MKTIQNNITEKQFEQQIHDLARRLGYKYYHTYRSKFSEPGYPDCTLLKNGRLIFAELKSEKGTPTDAQEEWLESLRRVPGVEVYLWKPGDWPTIVRILQKEDI